MINVLFLIGRIVLGVYLIFNAYNHFKQVEMLTGYAAFKGVPLARLAVRGTGLILALGGLSIATGYQPYVGVALIVLFLVPVAFKMHNFWTFSDPKLRGAEFINFTKNLALAAAALMFLVIPTPWVFSLIP